MANIIDSFFISLGFKIDPSGAAEIRKQTESAKSHLLSLGNAVKAFATGYVVKSITDINSTFEQNRIQIAGFLNALGLSGSFEAGLQGASDIIAQITRDAAKLPGEAEDYIEVFKTNAAYLKTAMPGGDAGQIAAFTNRLTAVAKTVASTMDAGQIARESGMLLAAEGRAGSHNVLWQKLMPFLMQVDGQAKITAQSFNAMTQPQRVELLGKAFDKLQPALDAASDTFDAMWGAAVSGFRIFVRAVTPDLFKGLKTGIATLTGLFITDEGKLTSGGQAIADVLENVGYVVMRMIRFVGNLGMAFVKLAKSSILVKAGVLGILGAMIGLQKLIMFGLIGAIALVAEDLYTFYQGGESVTGLLVQKFAPALELIKAALVALGIAFVAAQSASTLAAVASAAGWMVANAPLIIMLGLVGLLIYSLGQVITKWDQVKNSLTHWPKIISGKLGDLVTGGGQHYEDQARAAMGKAADEIDLNRKLSGMGPKLPTAAETSDQNTYKGLGPFLPGTPDAQGRVWQQVESGSGTVVNNNVKADIKIETNDPVQAGTESARAIHRTYRKGFAY